MNGQPSKTGARHTQHCWSSLPIAKLNATMSGQSATVDTFSTMIYFKGSRLNTSRTYGKEVKFMHQVTEAAYTHWSQCNRGATVN